MKQEWLGTTLSMTTKSKVDFSAAPHAVFTRPQVASVGLKEEEAKQKFKILVGIISL